MHGEKVSLTVDQRAGVAKRARVAEKRNVELLRGFVEGKKDRIVHLFVLRVANQVRGFGSQLRDAAPKLVGHFLRAAGGHHRYREEFVAVTGHQLMHPVVIAAANCGAERARILRRHFNLSRENHLQVYVFAGVVLHAVFHIVAALLPAHDFVAAPVRLGIIKNLMGDRFFEVGVGHRIFHRRQIMLELRVKIFAIADALGCVLREGLG